MFVHLLAVCRITNYFSTEYFQVDQLIKQTEAKNEKVNFIFMVGGFSESPFLKQEIKNKFEKPNV